MTNSTCSTWLQEFDEVFVTGTTYEKEPVKVTRMKAVVAMVFPENHVDFDLVKVWPEDGRDPQLPEGHDSRLWFVRSETVFERRIEE